MFFKCGLKSGLSKNQNMNIRFGKAFYYPRQIAKRFLSFVYPLVIRIYPLPKVMSIEDTINEILNKNCSIARFWDSEFLFLIDKFNLPYQKYDEDLVFHSGKTDICGWTIETLATSVKQNIS